MATFENQSIDIYESINESIDDILNGILKSYWYKFLPLLNLAK